jgi:hypothetical protein
VLIGVQTFTSLFVDDEGELVDFDKLVSWLTGKSILHSREKVLINDSQEMHI